MKVAEAFGVNNPRVHPFSEGVECVNPALVIGMELEIENCVEYPGSVYSDMCKPLKFDVKTDGSLRGIAYEFISKPMASSNALGALNKFFTTFKFDETSYSDRCSVHVHVNCTDMELEQVSSVALLYTVVEEILFEFVGGSRDTNIFCIPWNQCRAHYDLVNSFLKDPSTLLRGWNKYTALNLIPLATQGTVEFRQMHGTNDIGKLTKWINIIGAIFKYAKETQLNNLIEQIKSLNTTSHYEAFFAQVLGNQLPYNEVYSQKLEEGIILAKFSLVSWKKDDSGKKAVPKVIANMTFDDLFTQHVADEVDNYTVRTVRRRPPNAPQVMTAGVPYVAYQELLGAAYHRQLDALNGTPDVVAVDIEGDI